MHQFVGRTLGRISVHVHGGDGVRFVSGPPGSPYPSQQRWAAPPPPRRRRGWPWVLLVVAVIAVLAASIGIVVVGRGDSSPVERTPTASPVSADSRAAGPEDEPAGLIEKVDPVCADYQITYEILAQRQQSYAAISQDIPASQWTEEQRTVMDATVRAIQSAVSRYTEMLPKAENRVVQQLLAQTIVYLTKTADSLRDYHAGADRLYPQIATGLGGALDYICRSVLVVMSWPAAEHPAAPATVAADPAVLVAFMPEPDSVCGDFMVWWQEQDAELSPWYPRDQSIPGVQWTPEQRDLSDAARTVLQQNVGELNDFSSRTSNPVFQDFLSTMTSYTAAYADMLADYTPDAVPVWGVVATLSGGLKAACQSA